MLPITSRGSTSAGFAYCSPKLESVAINYAQVGNIGISDISVARVITGSNRQIAEFRIKSIASAYVTGELLLSNGISRHLGIMDSVSQ